MPRKSDAKERLMSAALELIWGHSYGATSVDAICDKADVKKGSFYYFFESKSELATAALEADWAQAKAEYDRIFSASVPPLQRLTDFFDRAVQQQGSAHKQCGSVLGCPLFSLGCEVSTQDPAICGKVREILGRYIRYFESAIRDAHAQGTIQAANATTKAKVLFAFFQGTLMQARIHNDLALLGELKEGALELLGVRDSQLAPN